MRVSPRTFVLLAALCAFLPHGYGATLLLDNFNADAVGSSPAGWTVIANGGNTQVQNVPSATDRSARLSKTSGLGDLVLARSFAATGGKVAVELKVRSEETAGTKTLPDVYSSGGALVARVVLANGNLSATKGTGLQAVGSFTAGTWYLLRLELDTDADTYDLYVDGLRVLTGAAFANAVGDVGKVTATVNAGSTGTAYVDGVNVFGMAIPAAQGTYQVWDDFNAQATGAAPANWTATTTGGTVTVREVPFAADKSVLFQKSGTANAALATRAFPSTSGKVTIELKVRNENLDGVKNLAYVNAADGTKAVSVQFNGSNLSAYNGGTLQNVVAARTGTWFLVRIVLDTATSKYDLYVDAQRLLTQASFRNAAANVASVTCGIDNLYAGSMYVDNLKVYTPAGLIGAPPAPVFDVASYGAVGDGATVNTAAIQAAIDVCAGSGGSVYLHDGTFVSGTLQLRSAMTFFVDSSAVLLGTGKDADFPDQSVPQTDGVENFAMQSKKALLFLRAASNVVIDGGGRIDGAGQNWAGHNGDEPTRAMLIFPAMCNTLAIRNVYLERAAMWCVVPQESSYLAVRNVDIYSDIVGNRDGIDPVDCSHVLIEDCALRTDDDQICPKSGRRTGVTDLTARRCFLGGSTRASGVKFGTRGYGAFTNSLFEDLCMKNIHNGAMNLESVDGSDISGITFRRIDLRQTNSPFYYVIGTRGLHPSNDVSKIGSIKNILAEDIYGTDLRATTGSPISGNVVNGVRYPLQNLTFRRVNVTYLGGKTTVPGTPPEQGGGYPECDVWGDLPAYGYFLRHVDGVTFAGCTTNAATTDARSARTTVDVTGLTDAASASASSLTVSKLQYNPAPPSAAEMNAGYTTAGNFAYVELMNVGTAPVDLSGIRFGGDLAFDFTDYLPGRILAAGRRVLIVSNLPAFQFRYGGGLPVAGVFQDGADSPGAGGRLQVLGSDSNAIVDFQYAGTGSWPGSANGGGAALVLIRPAAGLDLNDPANWRASIAAGGSPGVSDSLTYAAWQAAAFAQGNGLGTGPLADPDGDGYRNLLEYARGTNPLASDPGNFLALSVEPLDAGAGLNLYTVVRFRYRPAAEDVLLTLNSSTDLVNWSSGGFVWLGKTEQASDTVVSAYRSTLPTQQEPARFYRLTALYRP